LQELGYKLQDGKQDGKQKKSKVSTDEPEPKKKKKKQQQQQQAPGNAKSGAVSEAALANASRMVERVLRMKVKVLDLKLGTGPEVRDRKLVTMNYVGRLSNHKGKVFDQSKGRPFSFRLGKGEAIKGWDIGVVGMRVGGVRRITVPPAAGYGARSVGGIPKNSTLCFDVTCMKA